MVAVRARPGQAILMHHQSIHGVGPNKSETERIHVYSRLTAANRPPRRQLSYHEATRDLCLETPNLRHLAERLRPPAMSPRSARRLRWSEGALLQVPQPAPAPVLEPAVLLAMEAVGLTRAQALEASRCLGLQAMSNFHNLRPCHLENCGLPPVQLAALQALLRSESLTTMAQ